SLVTRHSFTSANYSTGDCDGTLLSAAWYRGGCGAGGAGRRQPATDERGHHKDASGRPWPATAGAATGCTAQQPACTRARDSGDRSTRAWAGATTGRKAVARLRHGPAIRA